MLNRTSADAPQSVVPPIQTDGALPEEAGTYLKADNQSESKDCQASVPRSVITANVQSARSGGSGYTGQSGQYPVVSGSPDADGSHALIRHRQSSFRACLSYARQTKRLSLWFPASP